MLYFYRNLWHLYYPPPLSIEQKEQTEEITQFLFMFLYA